MIQFYLFQTPCKTERRYTEEKQQLFLNWSTERQTAASSLDYLMSKLELSAQKIAKDDRVIRAKKENFLALAAAI